MKFLFTALGFAAGALFASGRRTPKVSTPTPNKVMPGVSAAPAPTPPISKDRLSDMTPVQIVFTAPPPRYDTHQEIPEKDVEAVVRIMSHIDDYQHSSLSPYFAGPIPDDYEMQIEKKIDEGILQEIIRERKRSAA